mgnify:CR=1 FL=1
MAKIPNGGELMNWTFLLLIPLSLIYLCALISFGNFQINEGDQKINTIQNLGTWSFARIPEKGNFGTDVQAIE